MDFGRVNDNSSATMSENDSLRLDNPARDYLPYSDAFSTVAWPVGGRVSASSSLSDAGTPGGTRPERRPGAAMDGDPTTTWSSSERGGAVGQWLQVDAETPVRARSARLLLRKDAFGSFPAVLTVTSDSGSVDVEVTDPDAPVVLPVPGATTELLRVAVKEMSDGRQGLAFVVAELSFAGLEPQRPLLVPEGEKPADVVVLTADRGRDACVDVGRRALCAEILERAGEEDSGLDRIVEGSTGRWTVDGLVRPRPGPSLDALLEPRVPGIRASASSSGVSDPRGRSQLVVDGDVETGWTAASGDRSPTVTLTWDEPRLVGGVEVRLDPALAASTPVTVRVVGDQGEVRTAFIGSDSVARFLDGLTTTSLTVTFPRVRPEGTYDPFTRRTDLLPVGVSELTPVGVEDLVSEMRAGELITSPCGSGPTLVVDGRQVETSVTGTRGSIESLQPQSLTVCDAARGPARWPGTHPPGAVGCVAWSESPPHEGRRTLDNGRNGRRGAAH